MVDMLSSGNSLMDLRLLTLRAIADAWEEDNKIKVANKTSPASAPQVDSIRDKLTKSDDTIGAFNAYVENLRYSPVFQNLAIKFLPGSAKWNGRTQTWTKSTDEIITICLPALEGMDVTKLMHYYQVFPNFFGSEINNTVKETVIEVLDYLAGVLQTQDYVREDFRSLAEQAPISSNNFDLGVSQDSFFSFGAVTAKIFALAIGNAKFKHQIDATNIEDPDKLKAYYSDINSVLSQKFHFENPWAFNIRFVFAATQSEYDTNVSVYEELRKKLGVSFEPFWNASGEWVSGKIRTVVSLELPELPDDESEMFEALAAYNCIGPRYPFTCS